MSYDDITELWKIPPEFDDDATSSPQSCTLLNHEPYDPENIGHKVEEWKSLMGESWVNAVWSQQSSEASQEFEENFRKVVAFVENKRLKLELVKVYPPTSDIFSWSMQCEIKDVKVVILGQDPYFQPGKANGLAFSDNLTSRYPDSLSSIFEAMEIDGYKRTNRNLTDLAKQGVLLLNTILTVRDSKPKSHARNGWEKFTNAVIERVSELPHSVVFLLWGGSAISKISKINGRPLVIDTCRSDVHKRDDKTWAAARFNEDIKKLHENASCSRVNLVLTAQHPSPAANRSSSRSTPEVSSSSRVSEPSLQLGASSSKQALAQVPPLSVFFSSLSASFHAPHTPYSSHQSDFSQGASYSKSQSHYNASLALPSSQILQPNSSSLQQSASYHAYQSNCPGAAALTSQAPSLPITSQIPQQSTQPSSPLSGRPIESSSKKSLLKRMKFKYCNHFKLTNYWLCLLKREEQQIQWSDIPSQN